MKLTKFLNSYAAECIVEGKGVISEEFNFSTGTIKTKKGPVQIAYINPETSENTYALKDIIKNTYGGSWFNSLKTWGWWLNDTNKKEVIANQVIPCVKYLMSIENTKDNNPRDVMAAIAELEKILDSQPAEIQTPAADTGDSMDTGEIKGNLERFKRELMNAMSDKEFMAKMEPIIKFRNAQGAGFSLINTILILMQDKKAKMVKSVGNWKAANREVIPNSPRIVLWVPVGHKYFKTKESRSEVIKNFLATVKKNRIEDLTVGEKERLKKELNATVAMGFNLVPRFYDIRFTKQMEGKEDLVGNVDDIDKISWYEDNGEETTDIAEKINALLEFDQKDAGLKIEYTSDLGDARGASTYNGTIRLRQNDKKNVGLFNTIAHETAHELLHFKYIQSKNQDLGNYFVGTQQGIEVVEQQAELTAWIVLRSFNYNHNTSFNYIGIWGADKDKAVIVFDTVASTANKMVQGINKYLNTNNNNNNMNGNMQESKHRKINEITGEQVADLVHAGAIYDRSKEKMEKKRMMAQNPDLELNDDIIEAKINRIVRRVIKESLNNKRLR